MSQSEKSPVISSEYIKVLKGTLLAALAGMTVQGCSRVDGNGAAPLPTGPDVEMNLPTPKKAAEGSFVPKIVVTEVALGEPIVTIGGSNAEEGSKNASESEEVPILIIIDETEQPKQNQELNVPPTGQPGEPTASIPVLPTEQQIQVPSQEFSSLEPERLKDVAKKMEQGVADDEIIEQGRTVQVYSTKLNNGMSFVLVKENVDKQWDGKQSSVVFYDKAAQYVAYNTVKFGTRYLNDGTQELRFGKGKSSAIIRNAYMTPDPSGVSVLLSSREVKDSVDFLTGNKSISIYQQREETDPVTYQQTINIGGYVDRPTDFMREWDWLLDQSSGKHIYSIDLQPDGTFKEGSKSSVEINPTHNLE